MTNEQRHIARYNRRKAKRQKHKDERNAKVGGLTEVFTYKDMYYYGKQCCNGVRWKQSTQNFELHLFSNTANTRRKILSGKWKPAKYKTFVIRERGKMRQIDAPIIQDRQVHKVLAKKVLLPLYLPQMIYNNGASIPNKGFQFALNELEKELKVHYRKYGRAGWIILIDFKKFFPSIPHKSVYEQHKRYIQNKALRDMLDSIVAVSHGNTGMPLGIETSQTEMVALPSPLDAYIQCQMSLVGGHYMDDYELLVPPDKDPVAILQTIIEKATQQGFTVNLNKTKIVPLTQSFKYCKATYTLTETGAVFIEGNRDGVKRASRKIKHFKRANTNLEDVRTSVQSSLAYFEKYDSHYKNLKIKRLFYSVFGFSADSSAETFRRKENEIHSTQTV